MFIQPIRNRLQQSHRLSWLLAISAAAVLAPAALAQNYTTTVPTDILSQYKQARQIWTTNVWVYANTLFGILAVIEFAWSAAVMLLEKTDLQGWTSALVRKIMWIGAFYALLLNGATWIPAIIDSFNQIGANAAGIGVTLSPGDIFSQGLTIAGALMDAASSSGFFTNPGTSLAMAFAALLIVISYIIITINFVVTVVESYLVVSVGFIFLGFGGSRWTAPYVERFIGLAVAIGVKIILLYCLISTGLTLGGGWLNEAQGIGTAPHPNMTAFDVMGAALIFMMLCWQIPKLFSSVLGGSPALTGGDLIGAGVAVGSAALTAGALATGGVAAVAGGAGALAGVGSAGGAGSPGSGAASAVASVGSNASATNGAGGSTSVPPPPNHLRGTGSEGGTRRQPAPPTLATFALADVGGDLLAGSGFEAEKPLGGYSGNTGNAPPSGSAAPGTASAVADSNSVSNGGSSAGRPTDGARGDRSAGSTAERVQGALGGVSAQFRALRRRLGPFPSDAAPHVSPPRMPIDHND